MIHQVQTERKCAVSEEHFVLSFYVSSLLYYSLNNNVYLDFELQSGKSFVNSDTNLDVIAF